MGRIEHGVLTPPIPCGDPTCPLCGPIMKGAKMPATTTPKYPKIKVRLTNRDGNAFAILGRVKAAMDKAKVPKHEINQFLKEAMSGDYDRLLQTCCKWVDAR